jgi:hypothetical protein
MARWCEDGVAAAVWSVGADTKSRKRGGGDGVLGHALTKEEERKIKRGVLYRRRSRE